MKTKLSTKGQVVLPVTVRRRLGLRTGDSLDVFVEKGRVVLAPLRKKQFESKIVVDPETGLTVLDAGPDAPILTSEMVRDLLVDFP